MADDGKVELQGEVIEAFRGGMYRIALDNDHETLGYVSGKMRRYRIRINPGDRVTVELSPYDLTRGRITYRQRCFLVRRRDSAEAESRGLIPACGGAHP